jgi:hypothetical protein
MYRIGIGGGTATGVLASTGFDTLAVVLAGLVLIVLGLAAVRAAVLRRS